MSWRPTPDFLNRTKKVRVPRQDIIAPELENNSSVIKIGNDKFVCPKCNEGWTFSRMKTITCDGQGSHQPITFIRN
jgi:hypothetical protein